MVLIFVGAGAWFGYDGFIAWPNENRRVAELRTEIARARGAATPSEDQLKKLEFELNQLKERTQLDVDFQRVLVCTLPPIGFLILAFSLRNSRGEYRLAGDILSVPGHPPVPLDAITAIDKTDWDRKGIAYVDYELPGGKTGTLRLDDYIYQRPPTDEIYKRIEAFTGTADDAPQAPAEA